jgi:acyl-CoA dehydrogenase
LAVLSAKFACLSDIALLLLAGSLKRKEMVSGRFADAISAMYEISACLKLYEEKFQNDDKVKSILKLSILKLVKEADTAMLTNIESLPVNRVVKLLLKFLFFPFSVTNAKIDDRLIVSSSKSIADIDWLLENFSSCLCSKLKDIPDHPFYILFQGYEAGILLKALKQKVKKAGYKYQPSSTLEVWLQELVDSDVLASEEKNDWLRLNEIVLESLKVDDFENSET